MKWKFTTVFFIIFYMHLEVTKTSEDKKVASQETFIKLIVIQLHVCRPFLFSDAKINSDIFSKPEHQFKNLKNKLYDIKIKFCYPKFKKVVIKNLISVF